MKIGIDATTIYTAKPTGLGIYSINVVNELARLHDDLVVWTVDDSALRLPPGKVRKILQPLRFLGNELFQLRPFWVEWYLPQLLRRERVDVLYTTIPNGLSCSPVPHVVTVHDIIPLVYPEDAPRTVRWNFRHRLPRIFAAAHRIVAVSEFTRADLLRHYRVDPQKVAVVGEGFDLESFRPPADLAPLARYGLQFRPYLFFVGNSSRRKNLARLIQAFSTIRERIPHQLVLAGAKGSAAVQALRDICQSAGVVDRVTILDYVPYGDLPLLYGGADAFVFISEYEGFGLPVLEAMACGTPVIAAAATSLPEVTGDAAVLVDPTSEEEIAATILALVTDEPRKMELRTKGLRHCRRFSWHQTARQILELLEESGHA